MQGKCIIFSAPSGAGKTTILKRLLEFPELKLEFSISATTRKPRNDETHGKDYYFLSKEDFNKKIAEHELIEWEEVYENTFYGTLKSELERIWKKEKNVAFDVDVKGGINLKGIFGKNALSVFIEPPSLEILKNRLLTRGTDSKDTIQQRLAKAKFEISFKSQFDKCIINDILEQTISKSYEIVSEFLEKKL